MSTLVVNRFKMSTLHKSS